MPQLLLEFLSEEIPARMQMRAEADLARLMEAALKEAGLGWTSLTSFAGPRRLGCVVEGLPAETQAVREERKGPRVGAPEPAIAGFLRGAGLASLEACEKRTDAKGEFWVAVTEAPGRKTADVIAEAILSLAKSFPWPKSMKFGEGARAQRWVRPLHRVLCLFGGAVVPFEVFGIASGDETEGHRIHGPGPFRVKDFAQYESVLRAKGHVVLTRAERETMILDGARRVCAEAGLELIEDAGLLTEVAGLVEHPVPLLGAMDPDFLDLPPEVIQLSMKTHQKYFAVSLPPQSGGSGSEGTEGGLSAARRLAPHFVVIANQDAPDGGKAIAAGNARVLSARLSDARHFWDNDRKTPLSEMAGKLSQVTFHEKLGSVADKVERVAALARELAPSVGADPDLAERAARLAKADLVSEMVGEFPELQGVMGRYYALEPFPLDGGRVGMGVKPPADAVADEAVSPTVATPPSPIKGEGGEIADAIRDHYKPQGPGDAVPTAPVSVAVALADKLDTLVGFFGQMEKPSGSRDPYALRRAALGVIRILLATGTKLPLRRAFKIADDCYGPQIAGIGRTDESADLLAFFEDRLKVHLKDEGVRHDAISAVFALGDDDILVASRKAYALEQFLRTDDGAALLAGYRRAANILKAEEKKDGEGAYAAEPDADYLAKPPLPEERALIAALGAAQAEAACAVEAEDFAAAMAALARLRAPVDAFFEKVTVNAEDKPLRANRLKLLSRIRAAARTVADLDRIEG